MQIQKSTFKFLKEIKANNNRDWFNKNKESYKEALANVKEFVAKLQDKMNEHDHIEDHKIFRIYRDVRFSKNKLPYRLIFV